MGRRAHARVGLVALLALTVAGCGGGGGGDDERSVDTTAAPTSDAAAAHDPDCGPEIANGASGPWVCTFADDFEGPELDRTTWEVQTSAASGFGSHDDCYIDDPDNVAVRDGSLHLSVVLEPISVDCTAGGVEVERYYTPYTAASISTNELWSQTYGRYEIRARFPAATGRGLHGAFWLWPEDVLRYGPYPASGEIDVAEVFSSYNDRAIPYLHYLTDSATVTNTDCLLDVTDWHTYTLEWTVTRITISYDDEICLRHLIEPTDGAEPRPFDAPFMLVLSMGLGTKGNDLDPANPPPLPATFEVDYVRVWE